MSGIEAASLVLGAFPLLISAMEHYEDTKKVTNTWWKVKRAHKRDVGKIKDCQLDFRLNLIELLSPLVHDGIVEQGEYEQLLANPGGQGWIEDHVEEALRERLSDCHERYVEVLQDILELMARLSKECRVDDANFQAGLKAQNQKAPSSTQNQQAKVILMQRTNAVFEAKRLHYAFTGAKREDLFRQIGGCNKQLEKFLTQNDRISTLAGGRMSPAAGRSNAKHLNFYSHAATIFRLLDKVWTCHCRSPARLWLQHRSLNAVLMKMHLRLCSGQQCIQWRLMHTLPTLQLGNPGRTSSSSQTASQLPSIVIRDCSTPLAATRSSSGSTMTLTSRSTSALAPPGTISTAQLDAMNLENDGLCRTCSAVHDPKKALDTSLGRLSDGQNEYAVFPVAHDMPIAATATLADILDPRSTLRLTRVERYGVALTLASSHLQLHSTPWLKQQWTSEDVCFPTSANGSAVTLHGEPYILTSLSNVANSSKQMTKDRSFSTLGIVLLELCFGRRLEDHPLWSNSLYAAGKSDSIMRQAVAFEWLDDVQGEAGEEYATAVTWTLRHVPGIVKDGSWRADFAKNVVQPLHRYYEYLNPKK
ncbi:hypothetical protein CKM354_000777500 [Cercospora kikuchii]|uniref:DUF7580 domain-containing protein n=1 Tax=Cercospora kikuchii TaxID=84275 RepID=A0A9P3FEM8_9PEZI|nr:uncharacterized protein CKM354_000777500 [Cercospora kikuchii]GIZ44581.1 hypothetical protein CKM354_000777500 [Cercospora kikuchii]